MKKFLFSIICTLLPILASAQEPYVILIDNGTALEFRYDNDKSAYRDAMDIGPLGSDSEIPWAVYRLSVYSVLFDESFANCTSITSTAWWFSGFHYLETFIGLEYLNTSNVTQMQGMFSNCIKLTSLSISHFNTSNVTDMNNMFNGCSSLTSLDLSNFNTLNVTNMQGMFHMCEALTTIKVGSGWTTSNVTSSAEMFFSCFSLVGGAGTRYDSEYRNAEYARIDGGSANPGYLTGATSGDEPYWQELQYTISYGTEVMLRARNSSSVDPWMVEELEMFLERADEMYNERTASEQEVRHMIEELNWIIREVEEAMNRPVSGDPEPYAVLSDNNTVLTFYYDDQKEARGGEVIPISTSWYPSWTSNASAASLIISVIFDPSFSNCTSITSTNGWFDGCTSLTSITGLEYLNTSNVKGMAAMFANCSALTNLDVSHFNTSNVEEMEWLFFGCSSLTSLDVSNFDTSNVTSMFQMFQDCSSLTSLNISSFNTSNVAYMSCMFWGCENLTNLDVSNFDTSNVTNMDNMFCDCKNLTNLDVSKFNTTKVTEMAWMFCGCENLTNLDVSNFDTSNVATMRSMFYGCKNLTNLDVSKFNTTKVTKMAWMFCGCENLTNLDVSNFDTSNVATMYSMFYGCKNLTNLDVSKFNTTKVTEMAWMFCGCENLTNLDVSNFNTSNVTHMGAMFQGCSKLTNLDVSNFNTSNVTDMGWMFHRCNNLTNLDVSNFNTSNVKDMRSMFSSCSMIDEINLTNFNTSNLKLASSMFWGCSSLTNLDLSSFNTEKVDTIANMFRNCSGLRTIYVGDKWTTSHVTYGDSVFYNCTNLIGGNGTQYSANHIDYTYAHIDGGTANPGYLTDINGSGSSDLEQRRAELLDMIEQLVQQIDVCAYELSRKDPQRTSDLWAFLVNIEESIYDVRDRTERAESDAELDECEERIRQIREEIAYLYMRIAEYAVGDASFDGLTARVSGSATLDDAFESVGGRAVAAQTIAAIVWNADNALTADMLTGINNPNLLVYVTEASKAPSGVQNVVINGTAAEIVLTDASGNNNFYCPQSFTAQSISYTRNFSQTTQIDVCQGWETISLPFTVQSISHQTHGALTPFGGGNNGYPFWLRQLSSGGLSRATAIEANRPYLICMPNNTVYPSVYNQAGNITFSATNVTVPITSEQTASGAGVTLRPAFQQVAQSGSVYALNVGEARGEYPEGSVFERNYREIRPFQAYTSHGSGTRFITVSSMGGGDDGFTGIESIDSEDTDDNGTWHTLDGRRLEGKPTKKGVYIKDGRKYIIK